MEKCIILFLLLLFVAEESFQNNVDLQPRVIGTNRSYINDPDTLHLVRVTRARGFSKAAQNRMKSHNSHRARPKSRPRPTQNRKMPSKPSPAIHSALKSFTSNRGHSRHHNHKSSPSSTLHNIFKSFSSNNGRNNRPKPKPRINNKYRHQSSRTSTGSILSSLIGQHSTSVQRNIGKSHSNNKATPRHRGYSSHSNYNSPSSSYSSSHSNSNSNSVIFFNVIFCQHFY